MVKVGLLSMVLAACGGARTPGGSPQEERILEADTDREVSFDEMVADLITARVVYVGESHDEAFDHRAQLEILEALHRQVPQMALGVEMVQVPYQPALDAWNAGEGDEVALLTGVDWEKRWGFDFALYRALFVRCRELGIPIVALNARTELTRAVARNGLEALEPDLAAELPELDLADAAHRSMIERAFEDHPRADGDFLARMYAAQVVWDETMASRIAETLAAVDGPQLMLVIAGTFHVRYGLGVPKRAERRGAAPYRIVLPVSARTDPESPLEPDPGPPSHYRWVSSARR